MSPLTPALVFAVGVGTALAPSPLFLSEAGLIFVDVQVNGRTLRALIDSGSFRTIQISGTLAKTLGLTLDETPQNTQRYAGSRHAVTGARVGRFVVAQIDRRDVEVSVIEDDIERIAAQVRTNFDVILGWGFLSQFVVRIDYPQRRIEFDPSPLQSPPDMQWSFGVVNDAPVVTGTVGDTQTQFLFDTGAPVCNLDPSVAALVFPPTATGGLAAVTIGGARMNLRFRSKALTPLADLGIRAVIGTEFLRDWIVTLDPGARTISFYR